MNSSVVSFANCTFLYQGTLYANYCSIDVCGICHGDTTTCVCQPTRTAALALFAVFTGFLLPLALWVMARYVAFPASRGTATSFVVLIWLGTWAALALEAVGAWLPFYDEENNCQRLANLNILYAPAGLLLLVPLLWCLLGSANQKRA